MFTKAIEIGSEFSFIPNAFSAVTYTGNGGEQTIETGLSSVDFTVSTNGSGFWHDRASGDCTVKNDAGDIIESGSAVVNLSKVHIKSRSEDNRHILFDSIRGVGKKITTNDATVEDDGGGYGILIGFGINSFVLDGGINSNKSSELYIAYQTLYTHIKWGTTNQGKKFIEAYNPISKETMIMYQGSGSDDHQIPHSLGKLLSYSDIKNLDSDIYWNVDLYGKGRLVLNEPSAVTAQDSQSCTSLNVTLNSGSTPWNTTNESYILYGKAKSERWTRVDYTGTGATGHLVETKDVDGVTRKPKRVIIKAISASGSWAVHDTIRGETKRLYLNTSVKECDDNHYVFLKSNGFEPAGTAASHAYWNEDGVEYIALVEFETSPDLVAIKTYGQVGVAAGRTLETQVQLNGKGNKLTKVSATILKAE